ncbi:MAG TPA: DNA polymerase III subunit delta [Burkholderiales bacterium]|jgi:DNA polymerase-3 subunit delta|nr:DNA polymerase III subunit delta [Burkholderiales bacterium]HSA68651.1 DNA polymerase III subunit delta [Burkholderiales bacterium]
MRLRGEQLAGHLAKTLAPVYGVLGDEPLLLLEAADAVRAAARKQGYTEREVYEPGRSFDWSELAHAGASLSLFGSRKMVELRLASGKPAPQASTAIVAWCERPNPEALLLVTMPRPEGGGWWEAPWFLALNQAGIIVEIQSVSRAALPGWLEKRLARQKQSASREVLQYLADRIEGNLPAAHQEVQKLALLAPEGELSLETVRDAVADVARYDTYVAADALVSGDTARYLRVLEGLRGEGEAPTYLLFTLSSALFALATGERVTKAMQAVLDKARRYPPAAIQRAIRRAAAVDRAIKGVDAVEPWEEFAKLGLELHAS